MDPFSILGLMVLSGALGWNLRPACPSCRSARNIAREAVEAQGIGE